MAKEGHLKRTAVLTGYDASGGVVFEQQLHLDEYWEDSHPVIDQNQFRLQRGITRLDGKLYGSSGELIQQFENEYGAHGEYVAGKQRHDGS